MGYKILENCGGEQDIFYEKLLHGKNWSFWILENCGGEQDIFYEKLLHGKNWSFWNRGPSATPTYKFPD